MFISHTDEETVAKDDAPEPAVSAVVVPEVAASDVAATAPDAETTEEVAEIDTTTAGAAPVASPPDEVAVSPEAVVGSAEATAAVGK